MPLLLVVLGLVLAACGGGGGGSGPDTSRPLDVKATANRTTVEVNQDVKLTADVSGTGSGSAGVAWQATKGSDEVSDSAFSSTSGRSVTWTAPDETGAYTITATATSGSSQASDDVTINVVPVGDGDTYHLEGMVWSQGESPVEGVEIAFDGGYESVTSDAGGRWYKDGLRGEVTVTVRESDTFKPDDDFYPTSRTVNDYEWMDFYGEVLVLVDPYDVSGTVKLSDGSPLEGVRIDIHRHDETVVTDAAGKFTATDIGLETTLTPEKEGYVIRPGTYSVTGEEQGIEFEALTFEEAVIEFADPNLEAAVRDALRYEIEEGDPITVAHVPLVSSVTAWDLSISDLGGIEHFVYLDTFYLGYEDNSGLSGMCQDILDSCFVS